MQSLALDQSRKLFFLSRAAKSPIHLFRQPQALKTGQAVLSARVWRQPSQCQMGPSTLRKRHRLATSFLQRCQHGSHPPQAGTWCWIRKPPLRALHPGGNAMLHRTQKDNEYEALPAFQAMGQGERCKALWETSPDCMGTGAACRPTGKGSPLCSTRPRALTVCFHCYGSGTFPY